MSIMEQLESMKKDVVTTVTDSKLKEEVSTKIDAEKQKIKACVDELVRRGKGSAAYKFVKDCLEALRLFLLKILGHIKDYSARITKWFSNINSTQLEMGV